MDMDKFNEIIKEYQKGASKLFNFITANENDPFFTTKDGEDVMEHVGEIAKGSALLTLKMILINLQNITMDMVNCVEKEEL